jgi:hypothetical protein
MLGPYTLAVAGTFKLLVHGPKHPRQGRQRETSRCRCSKGQILAGAKGAQKQISVTPYTAKQPSLMEDDRPTADRREEECGKDDQLDSSTQLSKQWNHTV